jgi:hypothetical protein
MDFQSSSRPVDRENRVKQEINGQEPCRSFPGLLAASAAKAVLIRPQGANGIEAGSPGVTHIFLEVHCFSR